MKKNLFTKTLLASAITFLAGTTLAAPYEIVDLGKIEGGTNSFAYGINAAGDVVGYGDGPLVTNDDGVLVREFFSHSIFFDNNGPIDLGLLEGGERSVSVSINNSGNIIGTSDESITDVDDDGNEFTVIRSTLAQFQSGNVTKLTVPNAINSQGLSINNNDVIVGIAEIDIDEDDNLSSVTRGFIYDLNTQSILSLVAPLTDEPNRNSFALSINDQGDVVGYSQKNEDTTVRQLAFMLSLDSPDTLIELPSLGTALTVARDVNNNGIIVGNASINDGLARSVAFYFDSSSDTELNRIPFFADAYDNAVANAVNDSGQIVGQALVSDPSTGINNGFLFENGELKNLNDLIPCNSGWVIDNATNINNNGEIIGYGLRTEIENNEVINEARAFKLIPTGGAVEVCEEEPADDRSSSGGSWTISGLLLLGLYCVRRKLLI